MFDTFKAVDMSDTQHTDDIHITIFTEENPDENMYFQSGVSSGGHTHSQVLWFLRLTFCFSAGG